jgi:hypothetical protein
MHLLINQVNSHMGFGKVGCRLVRTPLVMCTCTYVHELQPDYTTPQFKVSVQKYMYLDMFQYVHSLIL